MKLRLRDDSLRLRLMQSEVDGLLANGRVEACTRLPGGRLVYALQSDDSSGRVGAAFDGGRVTVRIPRAVVRDWATSDAVSIRADQELDGGGVLVILVEKDFRCLAPRDGEDEAGMFPHPRAPDQGG